MASIYEFECNSCQSIEDVTRLDTDIFCSKCGSKRLKLIGFDSTFGDIVNPRFLRDLVRKVAEIEYRVMLLTKSLEEEDEFDLESPPGSSTPPFSH
ncbi:MAG TPA: hypothetical protein VJ112_05000 [Rhabdochlamydiaceae bacterium]|nr:hypothetical protein [Rhabdochlamydiaceae bacterium]